MSDTQRRLWTFAVVAVAGVLVFAAAADNSLGELVGGWAAIVGIVGLLVTIRRAPYVG